MNISSYILTKCFKKYFYIFYIRNLKNREKIIARFNIFKKMLKLDQLPISTTFITLIFGEMIK